MYLTCRPLCGTGSHIYQLLKLITKWPLVIGSTYLYSLYSQVDVQVHLAILSLIIGEKKKESSLASVFLSPELELQLLLPYVQLSAVRTGELQWQLQAPFEYYTFVVLVSTYTLTFSAEFSCLNLFLERVQRK